MRKKITAGNWKMNLLKGDVASFMKEFIQTVATDTDESQHTIIIAAPFIYLDFMQAELRDYPAVQIYAQNMHYAGSGAYTGEISGEMLKSIGVHGVVIGHSERREIFDESQEVIALKVKHACEIGMELILCCGEPLKVRNQDRQEEYVIGQLESALESLNIEQMSRVILAYEPIWAIGTGKTASPSQAQDIHRVIRNYLKKRFNDEVAEKLPILYGGSVKPGNARELFAMRDIDGGLIGGASLDSATFIELVEIHERLK